MSAGRASPEPGLCGACRHHRVVKSHRGSRFYLCLRSRYDRRYPRYPALPVIRCPGYEPGAGGGEEAEEGSGPPERAREANEEDR